MSECANCYVSVYVPDGYEFNEGDLCMSCLKDFEVTTEGELSYCVGFALQSHRYHWWEYALWLLTRMIRFSPVRYVFIQQSGYTAFNVHDPLLPQDLPSMVEFTQEMPIEEAKKRWPNTPVPERENDE